MEQRRLYRVRKRAGAYNSRMVDKHGWLWFLEGDVDNVVYWKSIVTGRETSFWFKSEMEEAETEPVD